MASPALPRQVGRMLNRELAEYAAARDIESLVAQRAEAPGFWEAAPRWSPEAVREAVRAGAVVWTDKAIVVLPQPRSALAGQFDGVVTLAETAADLAAVTGLSIAGARVQTAATAVQLAEIGAVEGVPLAPPATAAGSDMEPSGTGGHAEADRESNPSSQPTLPDEIQWTHPDTGEVVRSVTAIGPDGNRIVTDHFPDGRRIVTTEVVIESGSAEDAMRIAGALTGDRTPAELVPPDSCLGSKLRNADDVELVSICGSDGRLRSVRCHDEGVAAALRRLAGDSEASQGRGPIEVFVTSPLEGRGPLRIYDGYGLRRGRPRTEEEAVRVVDEILGERTTAQRPVDPTAPVAVPCMLVVGTDQALLVPERALRNGRTTSVLRAAGWEPSAARAEIHPDGTVSRPGALTSPAHFRHDQVTLVLPGASELSQGDLVLSLLAAEAATPVERAVVLSRLADFTGNARVAEFDDLWPVLLGGR